MEYELESSFGYNFIKISPLSFPFPIHFHIFEFRLASLPSQSRRIIRLPRLLDKPYTPTLNELGLKLEPKVELEVKLEVEVEMRMKVEVEV